MAILNQEQKKLEDFDYTPVWLANEKVLLVLGMVWQSLVGSQLTQKALKKGQQLKASHFAHADKNAQAVGLAKLPLKGSVFQKHTNYSAALLFAQGYPEGLFGAVIPLVVQEGYWVIAVRDGTVMAKSDIVVATEEEAYGVLESLSGPGMQILSFPNLDFLGTARSLDHARLQRVRTDQKKLGQGIVLLAIAGLIGAKYGWDYYQAYQEEQQKAAILAQRIDPHVAWNQAIHQFFQQTKHGAQAGFQLLMQKVLTTPTLLQGWKLMSQQCHLDPKTGWRCVALYERESDTATNQTFTEAAAANWKLVWQPLNRVTAEEFVPIPLQPIEPKDLLNTDEQNTQILSHIQTIEPLLQRVHIGKPERVKIQPPTDDMGSIERPSNLPHYVQRKIRLEGPLRSLVKVPTILIDHISWNTFQVFVHRNIQPNKNQSALQFILEGVLYAQE